ncbi:LCP family protein [Lentzea tibetensis]|nr:LCP family protein [Lentzea tibetensis]
MRRRARRHGLVLVRALWIVMCAALLAVSGVAWSTVSELEAGVERSYAIAPDAPKSQNAVNILIMGLTTRLDLQGQPLPDDLLQRMRAGESDRGGYNANTLILLHIPRDGSAAVAMSVPRDNLVTLSGVPSGPQTGKIKEAYGRAKELEERRLRSSGEDDARVLERAGREAGRRAQVLTVSAFLNVPIDHLVEISLVGFFHIATKLGGVDVCLNRATRDDMSGADFQAGPQQLNAPQALSFVRQRHGLANGDLDRTRRAQAFLAYLVSRLKSADVVAVRALIDVAKEDVVLSDGLDLVGLAEHLPSEVRFHTLPVEGGAVVDGQSVNRVDERRVQAAVSDLTAPAAVQPQPPPGIPCVD